MFLNNDDENNVDDNLMISQKLNFFFKTDKLKMQVTMIY